MASEGEEVTPDYEIHAALCSKSLAWSIDREILPLVYALRCLNIETTWSCGGHNLAYLPNVIFYGDESVVRKAMELAAWLGYKLIYVNSYRNLETLEHYQWQLSFIANPKVDYSNIPGPA